MATINHFSLPFRWEWQRDGTQRVAVTEQDTFDEIADCVELILRTVQGERGTLTEFGRPAPLEFTTNRELARALVQQAIDDSEPRARTAIERADSLDDPGMLRLLALYDPEAQT